MWCDRLKFSHDKIFLSHNQGLSLYGSTLVVLSVQHQTLHVYHIKDAHFYPVQDIGRICYVDDDVYLSSCVYHDCPKLRERYNTVQRYNDSDHDDEHVASVPLNLPSASSSNPSNASASISTNTSVPFGQYSDGAADEGVIGHSLFGRSSAVSPHEMVEAMNPPLPLGYSSDSKGRNRRLMSFSAQSSHGCNDHTEGSCIIYSLKHRSDNVT